MSEASYDHLIDISVVIPVYAGEATLPGLCAELAALRDRTLTPRGRAFRVTEVVLVWDRGPGRADETIRSLHAQYSFIRPVWLSRNFGQHAATLAGMSSSSGEWIVTMDEDGQHDPAYIGAMLDQAFDAQSQLVYASPTNTPPHGFARNMSSRFAKWMFKVLVGDSNLESFNSYRLMMGDVGRSAAAYTGTGVYLDVALAWVVSDVSLCRIPMRSEGRPASNYSFAKLFSHFGRLVISSGTRPLALVSLIGLIFLTLGVVYSIWILLSRLMGGVTPAGWTSTFVSILIVGGLTLFSLGVIAQYIRAATNMSLGKPLYVVVRDPNRVFPGHAETGSNRDAKVVDDQAVRD
jgi:polyisoprenyl-phosphate glycosyltransferase